MLKFQDAKSRERLADLLLGFPSNIAALHEEPAELGTFNWIACVCVGEGEDEDVS